MSIVISHFPPSIRSGNKRDPGVSTTPGHMHTRDFDVPGFNGGPLRLQHIEDDPHFRRSFLMLLAGVATTIFLFLCLPFTQLISARAMDRVVTINMDRSRPPPPPPIEIKPREEVKREEEIKPELAKEIPKLTLSQLDAALNPGSGGTAFGDFSLNLGSLAADDLSRIFELTEIDRPPLPIYQVAPVYPYSLTTEGIEGRVVLRFVVTPTGNVMRAIVMSSTRREFEKPAITAVEKWRFEPGMKSGVRVSVWIEQPFIFSVRN